MFVRLSALVLSILVSVSLAQNRSYGNRFYPRLRQVFGWSIISHNFGNLNVPTLIESPAPGNESTFFIPYNNVPVGMARWKDKLIITIPRRAYGIPSTVNWVSLSQDTRTKSPGLRPYPDLRTNTYYGRNGQEGDVPLVSVYRPAVDKCDRLWLVDTGLLEAQGGTRQVQPPALVVYDLNTNTMISRFILTDVIKNGVVSGLISVTVDTEDGDCSNAHAYIADIFEPGLVIYSLRRHRAWRMTHQYFLPDPTRCDFNVNGLEYEWRDGVFSVVLRTSVSNGRPVTYALFHPMCSYKEFAVLTDVLKNETLATRRFHFRDLQILGERGENSQSSCHGIHGPTGVVFFTQVAKNAIGCWNTHQTLEPAHFEILAKDDDLLFYPTDLKVDNEDEVWVLSNKFPRYFFSTLNPNEENFRIFRMNVRAAIKGTVCAQ